MTIVPAFNSLIDETDSAVKLSQYAQVLGLSEDQFFGLNNPATLNDSCNPIWTLQQRIDAARYLREAQTEIELITGFPLAPRWFEDEFAYYGFPVHARWAKIIAAGFKNSSVIHAAMALTWLTDPVTITHATTVTDTDEIVVYHPGTTIEIIPSSITITGGNVIITIPWARLIKLTAQNNTPNGLTYADVPPSATSPYETTVDIYRVYNDDSIQGGLTWKHRASGGSCACECEWCCQSCEDYSINACINIRNAETGALDLLPASYTDSAWVAACLNCYCSAPDSVFLNYKAGLLLSDPLYGIMQTAIIRLAHSKMPKPPCGCDVANEYWTRDRNVPESLSVEQANCPFGKSDGAWFAWKQAQAVKYQLGLAMG